MRVRSWLRLIPRDVVALSVCALVFFSIGVWWGVPNATGPDRVQSWGVDDDTPLGPLTQVDQILHPQPDPWLSYPLMHSFVAAAVYAPYFLGLVLTGQFRGASATFPFGLSDPVGTLRVLTLLAHVLSAFMAAIVVGAATWTGRMLWDRPTGIVYGILVLFSFPLVYYARVGNVDATAMAFTMLAVAAFVHVMQTGLSVPSAIALGGFVGAALATKESSVGLFVIMPVLILARRRSAAHTGVTSKPGTGFWRAAAAGAFSCGLVFGLGSGLLVDPSRFFAHVRYLRGLLDLVAASDVGHPFAFRYDAAGHAGYLRATAKKLVDGMTVPGLLLAAAGVGIAFRRRTPSRTLFWLPLSYLVYLFVSYRLVQIRYVMPAMLLLLGFSASALVTMARAPGPGLRFVALMLGLGIFGQETLVATDYTYQMVRDSRFSAGAWLSQRTVDGDVVAYFGPPSTLPPLRASVVTVRATENRGMYWKPRLDDAKVAEILDGWRARRPDFLITMPDYTSHGLVMHSHSLPPRLYEQLLDGRAGFTVAAEFHTPKLFSWLPQPALDYPVVNPPIRIFVPVTGKR